MIALNPFTFPLIDFCEFLCFTHAVRLHSDSVWDVGEDADGVPSVLPVYEAVSLEVKAVDIRLCTHSRQVPRYCIPLTHGQAWEVPIHIPIDGYKLESQK